MHGTKWTTSPKWRRGSSCCIWKALQKISKNKRILHRRSSSRKQKNALLNQRLTKACSKTYRQGSALGKTTNSTFTRCRSHGLWPSCSSRRNTKSWNTALSSPKRIPSLIGRPRQGRRALPRALRKTFRGWKSLNTKNPLCSTRAKCWASQN